MWLILALTFTLTLPVNDTAGNALPSEKLLFAIRNTTLNEVVGAGVGWPGEQVSIVLSETEGCFVANAWSIMTPTSSGDSNEVCKYPAYVCGDGCHR